MKTPPRITLYKTLITLAISAIASAVLCLPLKADSISIAGWVDPKTADHGRQVYIRLRINDNDGNPVIVNALVDPGDNGRLDFSAADAVRLGLPEGSATDIDGAGGDTTAHNSYVNGGRNPSVIGETDENPNFRSDVAGQATIGTGDTTTVGTEFYNSDPAGPGEIDIDYIGGTVTIWNHAQALKHSLQRFFRTQLIKAPLGDYDSDPNGSAYAVNVDVGSGMFAESSAFVVSPGVGHTLISSGLASSLGVTCSGPPLTFSAELGQFTVPSATVSLDVFSAQPSQSIQVGCLPDAMNPLNENFLGADFLGQYETIYVSGATSTLAATPVPEPASLVLLGSSILGLSLLRKRLLARS